MILSELKISQSNENFINIHNEDSSLGYFIEFDVQYPEKLHELHDLPFFSEKMKIEKLEKICSKLA